MILIFIRIFLNFTFLMSGVSHCLMLSNDKGKDERRQFYQH